MNEHYVVIRVIYNKFLKQDDYYGKKIKHCNNNTIKDIYDKCNLNINFFMYYINITNTSKTKSISFDTIINKPSQICILIYSKD